MRTLATAMVVPGSAACVAEDWENTHYVGFIAAFFLAARNLPPVRVGDRGHVGRRGIGLLPHGGTAPGWVAVGDECAAHVLAAAFFRWLVDARSPWPWYVGSGVSAPTTRLKLFYARTSTTKGTMHGGTAVPPPVSR